jgi:predicted acyl esterase
MASASMIPELDPEWIEKIEPTLPKIPNAITLQEIRQFMSRLDADKLKGLNESMPDLLTGLTISNIQIPMRDGVERELRIIRPEGDAELPVYLG